MDTRNDRPIDRAGRRAVGIAIVAGAVAGTLLAMPRYGLFSIATTALAGRSGVYRVSVATADGRKIAEFTGLSRSLGGSVIN